MCSKCSVVNYHTVLLAFALTVSPTASPKSSEKRASSRRPENGQRLAGNVGNPSLTGLRKGCPSSARYLFDPNIDSRGSVYNACYFRGRKGNPPNLSEYLSQLQIGELPSELKEMGCPTRPSP